MNSGRDRRDTGAANLFSRPIREAAFTVLRYDADGNLDPTFGGDGVVATRLSPTLTFPEFAIARAVAVWPDGRIVAGGTLSNGEGEAFSFGLARYLPDGTLDPGFGGGDGWLRTFFNVDGASVRSLIPFPNGAVLAAGDFTAATFGGSRPPDPTWPMALYGPDGGLNPFFGTGGVVAAPVGGTATSPLAGIKSAALTADGNIVAAGFVTAPGQAENLGVARFLGPIATDSVAPRVVSAVSRKFSSASRDLPLSLDPLGRGTVEPRLGGPTEIVLTLSEPVRAEDGFIDATEVTVTGAPVGLSVRYGLTEISVRLSRVPDRATITVALHGLRDSAGYSLPLTMKVRSLYGDADQNGRVDALDLRKIARATVSPPTGVAALIADLDLNGRIDTRDLLAVRRNLGHAL